MSKRMEDVFKDGLEWEEEPFNPYHGCTCFMPVAEECGYCSHVPDSYTLDCSYSEKELIDEAVNSHDTLTDDNVRLKAELNNCKEEDFCPDESNSTRPYDLLSKAKEEITKLLDDNARLKVENEAYKKCHEEYLNRLDNNGFELQEKIREIELLRLSASEASVLRRDKTNLKFHNTKAMELLKKHKRCDCVNDVSRTCPVCQKINAFLNKEGSDEDNKKI